MDEMAAAFNLTVTNVNEDLPLSNTWTFRSSLGHLRTIDYMFVSQTVKVEESCATDGLDMGSDHRAVLARITVAAISKKRQVRRGLGRGWAPYNGNDFRQELDQSLDEIKPQNLFELELLVFHLGNKHKVLQQQHIENGFFDTIYV